MDSTRKGRGSVHELLRVHRSKEASKQSYDRMSRFYDYLASPFEARHRSLALQRLHVRRGETILELGFGTGHCLKRIAQLVGEEGRVCGIDLSSGMLKVCKRRIEKAGLSGRVQLRCADAACLPYEANRFDAAFMSFALELFDTPEIPAVLCEIKRVLRPGGRLAVVSMSKEGPGSLLLKMYEWAHVKFPQYADCRPIYVEYSFRDAGFRIAHKERVSLLGLPGEIVVGVK